MYWRNMEKMTPIYSPEDLRRLEQKRTVSAALCWILGLGGFAACVTAVLVLAVGVGIGIEFALDRTSLSHVLLYMIMTAAVAVPVVFGFILLRRNHLTEGQNHS